MILKDLLTIVIPCKNESKGILMALDLLNYQRGIEGVSVYVADSSTDETVTLLKKRKDDTFSLTITTGGIPSIARNNGAKEAKTPYILFMDADTYILDPTLLETAVLTIQEEDSDMLTTKIRTINGAYNYVYNIFDGIQFAMKFFSPFCLGQSMIIRTKTFRRLGGFWEKALFGEAYLLSRQIEPEKFIILNRHVFTTARRFVNKGVMYMVKLMIVSFIKRTNPEHFTKDYGYWR